MTKKLSNDSGINGHLATLLPDVIDGVVQNVAGGIFSAGTNDNEFNLTADDFFTKTPQELPKDEIILNEIKTPDKNKPIEKFGFMSLYAAKTGTEIQESVLFSTDTEPQAPEGIETQAPQVDPKEIAKAKTLIVFQIIEGILASDATPFEVYEHPEGMIEGLIKAGVITEEELNSSGLAKMQDELKQAAFEMTANFATPYEARTNVEVIVSKYIAQTLVTKKVELKTAIYKSYEEIYIAPVTEFIKQYVHTSKVAAVLGEYDDGELHNAAGSFEIKVELKEMKSNLKWKETEIQELAAEEYAGKTKIWQATHSLYDYKQQKIKEYAEKLVDETDLPDWYFENGLEKALGNYVVKEVPQKKADLKAAYALFNKGVTDAIDKVDSVDKLLTVQEWLSKSGSDEATIKKVLTAATIYSMERNEKEIAEAVKNGQIIYSSTALSVGLIFDFGKKITSKTSLKEMQFIQQDLSKQLAWANRSMALDNLSFKAAMFIVQTGMLMASIGLSSAISGAVRVKLTDTIVKKIGTEALEASYTAMAESLAIGKATPALLIESAAFITNAVSFSATDQAMNYAFGKMADMDMGPASAGDAIMTMLRDIAIFGALGVGTKAVEAAYGLEKTAVTAATKAVANEEVALTDTMLEQWAQNIGTYTSALKGFIFESSTVATSFAILEGPAIAMGESTPGELFKSLMTLIILHGHGMVKKSGFEGKDESVGSYVYGKAKDGIKYLQEDAAVTKYLQEKVAQPILETMATIENHLQEKILGLPKLETNAIEWAMRNPDKVAASISIITGASFFANKLFGTFAIKSDIEKTPSSQPTIKADIANTSEAKEAKELSKLGAVQKWVVKTYAQVEGDMSHYMLAPTAFKDIPAEYWPGNIVKIFGIKVPEKELAEVWKDAEVSESLKPIVGTDGNYIFWFHPLACEPPPKMPFEQMKFHAQTQRTNLAAYNQISQLFEKYPGNQITGDAIVSASVRTVLLFQVNNEPLKTPYELKLNLPYFINYVNRGLSFDDIEGSWKAHKDDSKAAQLYFGSSINGSYKYQPEYDGTTVPAMEQTTNFSFGYFVRDSGFKLENGKVHFQIPFFALFGDNSKNQSSIMATLYDGIKQTNPDLSSHDFVIDYLITPYVGPVLKNLNSGLIEMGFHYQNPLLKLSIPETNISEPGTFAWTNSSGVSIEGVMTKEIRQHDFSNGQQYLKSLMRNLWSYFATETNWAAAFKNFDRQGFKDKMYSLLEANSPPQTPPAGVTPDLWIQYLTAFNKIKTGLTDPAMALVNELTISPGSKSLGIALNYIDGSMIFATKLTGMKSDSERTFIPMFDKLAFLTLANPTADIYEMVAQENKLYNKAKQNALKAGVTPENDPISFFRYVLEEAYSPTEISFLKKATQNHAGLVNLNKEDKTWLSDFIFNPATGVFQNQLNAYKLLNPKKQSKVDFEHLPRITYWFKNIIEKMIKTQQVTQEGDAFIQLANDKSFMKFVDGLKTYEKDSLLHKFLKLFGI